MTGENDKEGRVSAIASWDTRKYLCKKLINMSISCIVDEAPNEIRATPSGFVPSSLLNSSINRKMKMLRKGIAIYHNSRLSPQTLPATKSSSRSQSLSPATLANTPVLQSPPVRIWNPASVAKFSKCLWPMTLAEGV